MIENRQMGWQRLDEWFARPMCFISLASLVAFAGLLHFHEREEYGGIWFGCAIATAVFWLCFALEFLAAWRTGSSRTRERLWCCVLPPWRLVARDHETGTRVWLPGLNWQVVSPELKSRLEKASSVPMIVVALLVLPLIGIEYRYEEYIHQHAMTAGCIQAATSLVWLAFTLEFVVMCSFAERKLVYCREHWLDLLIILLPLVAFLRVLRLGRLLRLNSITRATARAYQMRGMTMRAWRALLVLDVVQRMLKGRPEQRVRRLEELIAVRERELAELRAELGTLRERPAEEPMRKTA